MTRPLKALVSLIQKTSSKTKAIAAIFLFVSMLTILAIDQNSYGKTVQKNDLIQIKGTLKSQPFISSGKNSHSLTIHLTEIPEFDFFIGGWRYKAFLAQQFVTDCNTGDTVYLDILESDYNSKIIKADKLRFSERIINYSIIEPYSVRHDNIFYLTFQKANGAFMEDHQMGKWFIIYFSSITFTIAIIYLVLRMTGAIAAIKRWFPKNDTRA